MEASAPDQAPVRLEEKRLRALWIIPAAGAVLAALSLPFFSFLFSNPGALGLQSAAQVLRHVADALCVAVVFMGCFHFGNKLLRLNNLSKPEAFLLAFGLGEALLALALMLAGLLGFFLPGLFWAVFAALLYGTFRERTAAKDALAWLARKSREKVSPFTFFCLLLIALGMAQALIATCAPPTDWDSLAYHLAYPKLLLQQGRVVQIDGSYNYPLNIEMVYTLAMALRGDLAAQWVNLGHGILLLGMVFVLARRYFSSETALLAVALLSVQPLFQRVSGNALTDHAVTLASLTAFYAFLRGQEDNVGEGRGWLLLSGCFTGIAMSDKLTGLWTFATLFIFIAIQRKGLGAFLLGAAAFGSAWYLKNWIWTGNPLWPHLGSWFGAAARDLQASERLRAAVTEGVAKTPLNLILLPLKMVLQPEVFLYQPQYLVAPFLILLATRLGAGEKMRAPEKKILALAGTFTCIWFWVFQSWRYLLPVAALLAILTAAWTWELRSKKFIWLALLFAVLPVKDLSVGNAGFGALNLKSKTAPGTSPRDRYLELTIGPYYRLCRLANQALPPGSKVLLFRDVRGYYLDCAYAWGDPLNRGVVSYAEIKDARELAAALRKLGFTHVLYNPYLGDYKGEAAYYARANGLMREALRDYAKPALMLPGSEMGLFELN